MHNAVCFVAPRRVRHVDVAADHPLVSSDAWRALKSAVTDLRALQVADGSVPEAAHHEAAAAQVGRVVAGIEALAPQLPHDADYLEALVKDFGRWADGGFEVPDFYDSLVAFAPAQHRVDGLPHLVVFPMYTQNGNPNRQVEAVLLEVIWPDFVADLEGGDYSNKLFLPIRFLDFTAGYDTNSAVLFPETVAMREVPNFTWGGIFADREAARFRRVVSEAAAVTRLSLPPDAARLIADQELAERAFVMWDLIHDRTHMHGDLPFDPFMIKQRMPYFLYSLEELRCDLTAFREAVTLEAQGHPYARSVQYAVLFDRIFRFAITGDRTRNYDGLGGQLLFAWLHQQRRAALDRQPPHHRVGARRGAGARARARGRGPLLALDRPAQDRALARGLRPRRVRADAAPAVGVGPTPRRRPDRAAARRAAQGADRRGAARRVPALDVLRGPVQEDEGRHRVDGRDHRGERVTATGSPGAGPCASSS